MFVHAQNIFVLLFLRPKKQLNSENSTGPIKRDTDCCRDFGPAGCPGSGLVGIHTENNRCVDLRMDSVLFHGDSCQ